MRQSLLFIFLLSVCSVQAQFKKLTFDPNVKINAGEKNIQLVKQQTNAQPKIHNTIEYTAMDLSAVAALKSGLTPGILNENMVPAYIEGSLKNSGKKGRSAENLAWEYLENAAPLMKIKEPTREFTFISAQDDELGMTHIKLQQQVKGVPVYGAYVMIHGQNKNYDFLNGSYFPTINLDKTTPSFDIQMSKTIVRNELGEKPEYTDNIKLLFENYNDDAKLVVYPYENSFYLAYHVSSYKNIVERWEYFIDANTGKVLNKYQSICKFHNHTSVKGEKCNHAEIEIVDGKATANSLDLFNVSRLINTYQVGNKFYMIDGSRDIFSSTPSNLPDDPEGVIWTIDAFNTSPQKDNFNYGHVTSSNNIWNNKTAVSSHYNGGKAFEYFRNSHNRKSINGSGGNIISLINVADEDGGSMGNAFWNGQAMFYGNGDNAFQPLAKGLDVAGHEMTHGVVEGTANLEYQGESGALNESFADIFGVMIDRDDWKIGEDVVKTSAFPSGALRSMEDPHNGASTNDFNSGWQPRHFDERYKGNEDNGGVHINSGIPNFAFFKFATAVGKDKAEKVYYRALSNYLTKSSKFVDCRIAVIKATTDLYGTTEINAAKKAFDEVGILGEQGGNYETDLDANPGQEFVLTTNSSNTGLFIYDTNGNNLGTISGTGVLSKPSISDDGREIVFVGKDDKIHYIFIDWTKNPITPQEQIIGNSPIWRNAIISKDGLKIAALTKEEINEIEVFYFGGSTTTQNVFELYNPTYTEGVTTGYVNYADAMEFDVTGEYIMYDAENEINSTQDGSITYWDVSFIKVWNNASNTFSLGKVEKLFSSLPPDVSIGNPSFSKNSPYIIALDYIDENEDVSILGANVETGEVKLIFENNTLGYPNYSSKDNKIVFDNEGSTVYNIGIVNLKPNKIEANGDPVLFTGSKRWATWFSNGSRVLSDVEDDLSKNESLYVLSNPMNEVLQFTYNGHDFNEADIKITDVTGKVVLYKLKFNLKYNQVNEINISNLMSGIYYLSFGNEKDNKTIKFIKM